MFYWKLTLGCMLIFKRALWLCEGRVQKRDNGLCSPWCQTLQFFPVCHWWLWSCYTSEWVREWIWVSPCVGSLRDTAWDSRSFFHWLYLHWFLQPEVVGTYLPGTQTLSWGVWCGARPPYSWDIPPKFLFSTRGCGTRPFHICISPASLDGRGFFNSIVVRLPFNSISNSSKWRLSYILVVILLRLCEEASRVCLCCHLDQKSLIEILTSKSCKVDCFILSFSCGRGE